METVCQVFSFEDLVKVLRADNEGFPDEIELSAVEVKPYSFDRRIGWDTHIVTIAGYAIGFTDGPIERKS